ncbi:N-acetyl-1-D-myo-inositol-2-amino-2-deoxy-alpha-D-glucopyranoside deacetylase [Janibacter sp. G1551]|uniref:N-acetyl-1-D-myo-inositol-2-amino-2-deoxy-alpha- D-glucopyranoside deacetylase n=1 Tax=Janibacter sp. G1551 TaxID=3420440 RepID=UPI003D0045A0
MTVMDTRDVPRLLFVHAHPDDESLATGLALAHHSRAGHEVHVLTATLGEEGEVIPPELAHLAADRDDTLGPHRREELRAAMAALGVRHRVLGEDPAAGVLSRYRDSGMVGSPSATNPRAWVNADPQEAAALVRAVVEEIAPDVVVTYDAQGGYSHPDHIQVHRIVCVALAGMSTPPALFAAVTPRTWAQEDRAWVRDHPELRGAWTVPAPTDPYPPSVVDDALVTHAVIDPDALADQVAALREHVTQVTVGDGVYALSNDIAARLSGREGYALLDPRTGALRPAAPAGPARLGLLDVE